MKTKTILFLAIMAIVLSSCLVKSLHPFYTQKDVIFDKDLIGIWMDTDSATWEFRQHSYQKSFLGKDTLTNSYEVIYRDKDKDSSRLIATLFKLKKRYYLDFYPMDDPNEDNGPASWHWIPAHSLANFYSWGKDNVTFSWYGEDWLEDLFKQNRIKIAHEETDKSYVLTASTEELQKFIRKYADEHDIMKDIDQDRIIKNPDKAFVFKFVNDYLDQQEKEDKSKPEKELVINLERIRP